MSQALRLIVGLGNPDPSYGPTRHNIGRRFVDHLAQSHHVTFKKKRRAEMAPVDNIFQLGLSQPVTLAKLTSSMNESGPAFKELLEYESIPLLGTLIVMDDFMIPFGSLRLRTEGSSGGHNGLESIISSVGAQNFCRLRFGIGPVPTGQDPANFVLHRFSKEENAAINDIFSTAIEGLKIFIEQDPQKSMNYLNKKPS